MIIFTDDRFNCALYDRRCIPLYFAYLSPFTRKGCLSISSLKSGSFLRRYSSYAIRSELRRSGKRPFWNPFHNDDVSTRRHRRTVSRVDRHTKGYCADFSMPLKRVADLIAHANACVLSRESPRPRRDSDFKEHGSHARALRTCELFTIVSRLVRVPRDALHCLVHGECAGESMPRRFCRSIFLIPARQSYIFKFAVAIARIALRVL